MNVHGDSELAGKLREDLKDIRTLRGRFTDIWVCFSPDDLRSVKTNPKFSLIMWVGQKASLPRMPYGFRRIVPLCTEGRTYQELLDYILKFADKD